MGYDRDFYRRRAIQRQRDPDQAAKNAAASAAVRARVEALLADVQLIQQLNAAASGEPQAPPAPGAR